MQEKFGPSFKQLREKRGYSVKEAAGSVITPVALRKFEHGETSTSVDNFNRLLLSIGASWDDFFQYYQGHTTESIFNDFAQKYYGLSKTTENYKLLKLLKEEKEIVYDNSFLTKLPELLSFIYVAQSSHTTLSIDKQNPEIQAIIDHMSKVETWGNLELSIFGLAMTLFDYDFVHFHLNKILTDCKTLKLPYYLPKHRETLKIFFLGITYYNKHGYFAQSEWLIEELEKLLTQDFCSDYLYEKVLLRARKIFTMLHQNKEEALILAKEHIKFCEQLNENYYSPQFTGDIQLFIDQVNRLNKTGIPFEPY